MTGSGVITVTDLTFRYRRGFVLGPLSFTADRGITGLMGPNGAGKSTLSRLVCGASTPRSGFVAVEGHLMSIGRRGRAAKRLVGYVPQQLLFPGRARVCDVMHHAAWLHEVPARRRSAAVQDALAAVRLCDRQQSPCGSLSGGMLRRLAVAQALVHSPSVLFMDEPTTGLDPAQRISMRQYLRELGATRTIVLATHLAEDVQAVADQLLVIASGRILFNGTVPDFVEAAPAHVPGMSRIEAALADVLGRDGAHE